MATQASQADRQTQGLVALVSKAEADADPISERKKTPEQDDDDGGGDDDDGAGDVDGEMLVLLSIQELVLQFQFQSSSLIKYCEIPNVAPAIGNVDSIIPVKL
eukprot:12420415-Karenia_brevis.AAC.1